MPLRLLVTFMEKGPPRIRRKFSHPPLDVEPDDKTITLEIGGGIRPPFSSDQQWFLNFAQEHLPWAVDRAFRFDDYGNVVEIIFDK